LDTDSLALAQVIDIGRGEVIRTLDPLHPIETYIFSQ